MQDTSGYSAPRPRLPPVFRPVFRRAGPAPQATAPDPEALRRYWAGQRRGRDIPHRSAIDPRAIEPLLPHVFIAERIAPGLARLRVAGTHLGDLMGMEVRGMPLSALVTPCCRDALALALVELFDGPATLRLRLLSEGGAGRAALTGTLLILPLSSDLGDVSRALGCLVTDGPPDRAPRRFRITDTAVDPLGTPAQPVPPVPDNAHPSERPWLRLVT